MAISGARVFTGHFGFGGVGAGLSGAVSAARFSPFGSLSAGIFFPSSDCALFSA
jgi:hypothetical protein